MATGTPITPEQREIIIRVFHETANASEAARQAGVSEHAARNALGAERRSKRGELHLRALERAEREFRRAVVENLERMKDRLATTANDETFVDVTKAMHDGMRTLSQVRTAHAKAIGAHEADKVDVTSGGKPLRVYLPDEE